MSRLVEKIINAVCKETGITRKEIMSRERSERVSNARYMVVYLLRKRHGWQFSEIGWVLGRTGRTMCHGFCRISYLIKRGKVNVPRITRKELKAEKVLDEISEQLFEAIVRVI